MDVWKVEPVLDQVHVQMDDSQGRGEQEDQESLGQQTADENQSFYVVDLQQQITNRGGTEKEEVER